MATAELELTGKNNGANGSANGNVAGGSDVDLQMLLSALTALRKGDFSVRLPTTWLGLSGKVGDIFNEVMDQLEGMTNELDRISRVVGKEGKIKQRASSAASAVRGPERSIRSTRWSAIWCIPPAKWPA